MDSGFMNFIGVMFGFLVLGCTGYLAVTLIQVVRRKLLGPDADAPGGLETLRQRVAELEEYGSVRLDEETQHRMAELEERLDFAERLLAKEHRPAALPEATDQVGAERR